MNHFIIKCPSCSKIVGQCRCASSDKRVDLHICLECDQKFYSLVETKIDGNMWCCLYPKGSDLQNGYAIFKETPRLAENAMVEYLKERKLL